MKKAYLIIGLAAVVIISAGFGISSEASVEKGKQLFNDPGLAGSTNEASCAGCHPDGRGLEQSGDKANLAQTINMCIEGPLKGQALAVDSPEIESLKEYIKSIK